MAGKVYINFAQRKVNPHRLKLLWFGENSISGTFKLRDQIARLASEGKIKIIVAKKYLAATFDEKEILVLRKSEDYARILALNGVSEIVFDKGTNSTSIGHVLNVLATRGVKAIQTILTKSSMKVEILNRGQKIPEEIPDCVQMKVNAFVEQLALERFLKQEEPEESNILLVLEIVLNKFGQASDFPESFAARLKPAQLLAIENTLIRNVNQFRAIAPLFLKHPNASSQFMLCLIENEIVKDIQSAIDFTKREGLTIKEKAEIILAAAKKMAVINPESLFECLERNLSKDPYRGSKYQEYVKEILWAMVNSNKARGLKAERVKGIAANYNIPATEIEKYIIEMLKNGKILGEEALAIAENEFVPAEVVADVISRYLPKTGVRYDKSETVIPAYDEEIWESADKTGNWLIMVGTEHRDEEVIVHQEETKIYSNDDYERAATIINKHSAEKITAILSSLPRGLEDNILKFILYR